MPSSPNNFNQLIRPAWKPWYTSLVNVVGYGLLLFVLFDLVAMLIPPHFMNPNWEFQLFGMLVEKVAVPLIAIIFVFFGEEQSRGRYEKLFLKGLSWLCLFSGLALILFIPVTFFNVHRLSLQADALSQAQYSQQFNQLKQIEQRLHKSSEAELKKILQSQGRSSADPSNLQPWNYYFSPETSKVQLLSQLNETKQKLAAVYGAKLNEQQSALLKNGIKWSLGALLSGFIFIYTWWLTKSLKVSPSSNKGS
jgi:hypothetical protein